MVPVGSSKFSYLTEIWTKHSLGEDTIPFNYVSVNICWDYSKFTSLWQLLRCVHLGLRRAWTGLWTLESQTGPAPQTCSRLESRGTDGINTYNNPNESLTQSHAYMWLWCWQRDVPLDTEQGCCMFCLQSCSVASNNQSWRSPGSPISDKTLMNKEEMTFASLNSFPCYFPCCQ